jgi:hypothetical protein
MIRAERVLEPRMSSSWIDQKAVTDLTYVPEALNGRCVQREERGTIETDVVPEGISDNLSFGRDARLLARSP